MLSSVFNTLNLFKSKFDIKNAAENEFKITNFVKRLKQLKQTVVDLVKIQPQMDYNLSAVKEFITHLIQSLETVLSHITQLNEFSNISLKIKPRISAQEYVLEKPMFYKDGITKTETQITVTSEQIDFLGGKRRRYRKSQKPQKTRHTKTHRNKRR
jgi:hypothetical protein